MTIETPIMEKWIVKMAVFAKIARVTYLIKEESTTTFTKYWKPFMDKISW